MTQNKDKPTGIKGCRREKSVGLARWSTRGSAGVAAPSSSDCCRRTVIGTWNVRSLYQPGKVANVVHEMRRMGVDVMGIFKTFWEGSEEFTTILPGDDDKEQYKIIYSGSETKIRGVAFIINQKVIKH